MKFMYKQIEIYIIFWWLIHFGRCKTTDLFLYRNLWLLYSLHKCLHNKLKKVMRKGGEKQFITVTTFGANGLIMKTSWMIHLIKPPWNWLLIFCLIIVFLFLVIYHCNKPSKCPWLLDPTTYIAKLFLCYYVNKWLLQTKERDSRKTHLFSNRFSFIDNLCLIWKNTSYE